MAQESLTRCAWSAEAEAGLIVSAGDYLDVIKAEVIAGESVLLRAAPDGFFVARHEQDINEIVLVLGEGRNMKKWLPVFIEWAKAQGAATIRTHIKRPALKRIYERAGWEQSEIVMQTRI